MTAHNLPVVSRECAPDLGADLGAAPGEGRVLLCAEKRLVDPGRRDGEGDLLDDGILHDGSEVDVGLRFLAK